MTHIVKVRPSSLLQPFHPCTAEFIATVCHASCCRSTSDPSGISVVVRESEAPALKRLGADVDFDTLRVQPVNKRCPFQNAVSQLCDLHGSPAKPFGCIASPFTVNKNNTLIVRNRYRLLKCFKADGSKPVCVSHFASLAKIFGQAQAKALQTLALRGHSQFVEIEVAGWVIAALKDKNQRSKTTLTLERSAKVI